MPLSKQYQCVLFYAWRCICSKLPDLMVQFGEIFLLRPGESLLQMLRLTALHRSAYASHPLATSMHFLKTPDDPYLKVFLFQDPHTAA